MSLELKIKALTLGFETRQIRRIERKLRNAARKTQQSAYEQEVPGTAAMQRQAREILYAHRRDVVKVEARATHLARACIKGTNYFRVETYIRQKIPNIVVQKVDAMIKKYGEPGTNMTFEAWVEASRTECEQAAE